MIKPTGNNKAPSNGLPVFTVTVMAKKAASANIAPAIKARIKVSLVDIHILDSPESTILVVNSLGSMYAIKHLNYQFMNVNRTKAISMPQVTKDFLFDSYSSML